MGLLMRNRFIMSRFYDGSGSKDSPVNMSLDLRSDIS